MTLDEFKTTYKALKLWKRLLLMFCIAIIPSVDDLWNRWQVLMDERDTAILQRQIAEKKYEEAKERKKALPKLEERLSKTEAEMAEARKKLPDEFHMDQILEKTEIMAQQLGVNLKVFDPGEGVISESAFKFLELPIKLEMVGTFGQVVSFFDHIVHLELLVNLRNISIALDSSVKLTQLTGENFTIQKKMTEEEKQKKLRLYAKVVASCDMVVFRSLTDEEANAIQVATTKEVPKDKDAKDKKGSK
jgi:Tfp pilus assembly protein PilO